VEIASHHQLMLRHNLKSLGSEEHTSRISRMKVYELCIVIRVVFIVFIIVIVISSSQLSLPVVLRIALHAE
jgi:t-SNARE complex subunit (syntaxin)